MKFQLGLKLFASNTHLFAHACALLEEGLVAYIELYTPPGSENYLDTWKDGKTPYVIHGPHYGSGVNWADSTLRNANRAALATAQRYADALHAPHIIIHGGCFGPIAEVVEQLSKIVSAGETRLLLENTPKIGLNGESPATVYLPEHQATVQNLVGRSNLGLVLDIGHAIYAANSCGHDHFGILNEFLALKPTIFHLSDGELASHRDVHKNIGQGNFDLLAILACLPLHSHITLETPKDLSLNLADTREDVTRLAAFCAAC